jgi:hypothetical protein
VKIALPPWPAEIRCNQGMAISIYKREMPMYSQPKVRVSIATRFNRCLKACSCVLLCLSGWMAQATFTNATMLSASLSGTNLVLSYSVATTEGWVSLLSAGDLGTLASAPQFVDAVPVPPSQQGQFVVPLVPGARGRYFRLLLEPQPTYLANYPDLSDIIPEGQISIVGTGTNRVFQYTHDTFNGGSGPLEIQPVYNPASGNYQGYQHVYLFQSNQWTLVRTIPVAGAFVFDASHGHFHFPFAKYGLYHANPDGSIGALIAASPKDGFCIGDSYIYDSTLPNAGAFGNWGSCSDPTSLRGLSIGAVDEYDQTDEGQAIPIPGLADGTYWLRSIVDPYNYLAESDESNNETDTQLSITGNTVTVLQTVKPVLNPPPAITLSSPLAGSLSGTVQLVASSAAAATGVQFLVDGLPFGNPVTTQPYTLSWDTTAVPNGSHWLAAQTADATGRVGTSDVVMTTVTNSATVPPTVQITSPTQGETVSAVITVGATATAQIGVPRVQFYVDGVPLGAAVTNPPFMISWNTQTVPGGPHALSAIATDEFGLAGTNTAPVTVTVDNSHPANPIGTNAVVSVDGSDTMQTPAFSTTAGSLLLVAFVSYDGPVSEPQTATVSGAGLFWQLLKRSNAQYGTSEIWVAWATDPLSAVQVTAAPGVESFHGSMTVIAFSNASGAGVVGQASAPNGAPDIFLPGVFAGNWVFAAGNDWDRAVGRTPVSGQFLVHQRVDTGVGDTFWVQATTTPSAADGLVDIHDSAPTNDQWNYVAVEIVATRQ